MTYASEHNEPPRPGAGLPHAHPGSSRRRLAAFISAAALLLTGAGTLALAAASAQVPHASGQSQPHSGPQSPPQSPPQSGPQSGPQSPPHPEPVPSQRTTSHW